MDPRLDVLPTFRITTITRGAETTLVGGIFSRPERVAVDVGGWLFVSETESSIADIITFSDGDAGLDIPNWSMTRHIQHGAVLPWLDARWQAGDLAALLDDTKEWRRVRYRPTDAVVFATRTRRCGQCGWTGRADANISACPMCSGVLSGQEIVGYQEAAFPIDADARFLETRAELWDHDHCVICDVGVGRDVPWGYRESSLADGPNSVGLWLCEQCFERYVSRRDFSFLVVHSASD